MNTQELKELFGRIESDEKMIHHAVRKVEKAPDFIRIGSGIGPSIQTNSGTCFLTFKWDITRFFENAIHDPEGSSWNSWTLRIKWFNHAMKRMNFIGKDYKIRFVFFAEPEVDFLYARKRVYFSMQQSFIYKEDAGTE